MRVISGKVRGHTLKAPKGLNTRPTTDRVKESIFNIIQLKLEGSIVIDLFSGSGNLGIEALSRNSNKAYFIDNNKTSINSINENLKRTNFINNSIVFHMDVIAAIEKLRRENIKADIIFLDPPYSQGLVTPVLEKVSYSKILNPEGIIIVEHMKTDEIPDNIKDLQKYRIKKYGDIVVSFYEIRKEN